MVSLYDLKRMPLLCCNLPFAPLSKATPTMTRALHMVYNDVLKHNLALGVQVCQCITWYLNLLSESLKTWCFFVSESLYTRLFCHDFLISIVGIVVGELTTPAQSHESGITVLPKNVKSWHRVKVHITLASSSSHLLEDGWVLTQRCLPVLRNKGYR